MRRVPADQGSAEISTAQTAMILASVRARLARPEGSSPQQPLVPHSQPTSTAPFSTVRPRSTNNRPSSLQWTSATARASVSSRARWSTVDDRRLIALELRFRSWKQIAGYFPGRTPAACRQRIIQTVGLEARAARRPQTKTNKSAVASQTAVPGNHPVPRVPRSRRPYRPDARIPHTSPKINIPRG